MRRTFYYLNQVIFACALILVITVVLQHALKAKDQFAYVEHEPRIQT